MVTLLSLLYMADVYVGHLGLLRRLMYIYVLYAYIHANCTLKLAYSKYLEENTKSVLLIRGTYSLSVLFGKCT